MPRHPKSSPISAGYVRRTGPTSCSAMPYRGMHVEDFQMIRNCALLYARVLPTKMDVSLGLWGEFIARNVVDSGKPSDYTTAAGEYLSPEDAADYLRAIQLNYAPDSQHHTRSF